MTTLDDVLHKWPWVEIPNCPGRYKLHGGATALQIRDLLGHDVDLHTYSVPKARDLVVVATTSNFGIISYKPPDGLFVHTLNTPEGLARKLASLGITT